MRTEQDKAVSGSKLFTNSLWNMAAYLIVTALGIITVPIYVYYLGISKYGLLVLLSTILTPINLLDFGFAKATVKYVSESLARDDLEEAGTYIRTTLLFNLCIGTIGMIVIAISARMLINKVFGIDQIDWYTAEISLYWIAINWLIGQIISTYQNAVTAFQLFDKVAIISSTTTSIGIVISFIVLVLGGNLINVIQVRTLWNLVTILIWLYVTTGLLPGISLYPSWNKLAFYRSFRFGVWQTVSSVGSLVSSQTDRFLLGVYQSTSIVGVYSIPFTIQSTMYSVIYKLSEALVPAISNLQTIGSKKRAVNLTLRAGWFLSILTICTMGPLAIFASDILEVYVNIDIAQQAQHVLKLFAISGMLSSGSVSIFQYLTGTGRTEWLAVSTLVSGAIILIGGIILIPQMGLVGAGYAQLLAVTIGRPVVLLFLWQKHFRKEVNSKIYLVYLYSPAIIGITTTQILIIIRQYLSWHMPNLFTLIICGVLAAIILFGVVYVISQRLPGSVERQEDLQQFWQMAKQSVIKKV